MWDLLWQYRWIITCYLCNTEWSICFERYKLYTIQIQHFPIKILVSLSIRYKHPERSWTYAIPVYWNWDEIVGYSHISWGVSFWTHKLAQEMIEGLPLFIALVKLPLNTTNVELFQPFYQIHSLVRLCLDGRGFLLQNVP